MSAMNIKDLVNQYCRANLLRDPYSDSDYIHYAERLLRVALITQSEYNNFVMSINTEKGYNKDAKFS